MNSLIRAIERNTAKRKKIKNRIDSEINLSVHTDEDFASAILSARSGGTNRLIDEGAIIEGDGSVWAYIKKGTLEKFMNGENVYLDNLPDDFVGYINIGHLDHATFPFPVGEWRKEDMTLVDIGDGRQAIDMNNSTIDRDSVFIRELERLGLDVSESIEATFHFDFEASEDLGFPVVDEVLIYGFAVVGDGKNVNSNGLQLKGENSMSKEKLTVDIDIETNANEVIEEINEVEEKVADLGVEEIDITVDEEEVAEEAEVEAVAEEEVTEDADAEENAELSADDAEEVEAEAEAEDSDEEDEVEEDGEEAVDEDEVEEADELDEALSVINELKAQIAELSNTVAELRKKNRRISNKLAAEKEAKADFLAKTKELSVELLPNELEAEKAKEEEEARLKAERDYKFGDGIADI